MQEIFPRAPTGPLELISPRLLGELSRRLRSEFDVQNCLPSRNGLVGNSRMVVLSAAKLRSPDEFTGLRIQRDLPSTEEKIPAGNGLGIGPNCLGCGSSGDGFLHEKKERERISGRRAVNQGACVRGDGRVTYGRGSMLQVPASGTR